MPWTTAFEDPVPLPGGRQLVTLEDAAGYIVKRPKAEQRLAHWQTAAEILLRAAEGREPLLHARIGLLRAINHGRPAPAPGPRRKAAKAYRILR